MPATLTLQQLLIRDHILINLDVTSKKRVFEEVSFLFERTAGLSRTLVADSLFARERLGTTALGNGVAIPHGRIKGLKEPHVAAIQLKNPIGFDAADEMPVCLLFVLLVPESATQKHLDLLSEIAEVLGNDSKRSALKNASAAEQVLAIIQTGTLL